MTRPGQLSDTIKLTTAAVTFPAPDPILDARTMQRTPIDLSIKGIWLDASAWESL